MIVGGYTLHLYCDAKGCSALPRRRGAEFGEFYGASKAEAFAEARKKGWRTNYRARTTICPKCAAPRRGRAMASERGLCVVCRLHPAERLCPRCVKSFHETVGLGDGSGWQELAWAAERAWEFAALKFRHAAPGASPKDGGK